MTEQWPAPPAQHEILAGGPQPRGPQRARGQAFAIGAAALAGGLVLGAMGIARASGSQSGPQQPAAQAQAGTTSPSQSPAGTPTAPAKPDVAKDRKGRHGPMTFGRGVLHGEFVTRKPDGGYQSFQVQRGSTTSVSATSITVKSDDGFTRSYVVNADTLVNATRDGISSVAIGDVVHVKAMGAGNNAVAVHVADHTKMKAGRERFQLRRDNRPAKPDGN